MVTETRDAMLERLEHNAVIMSMGLIATVVMGTKLMFDTFVHSGPCKVTAFEARDVWQYRVVDNTARSSLNVTAQQQCKQCSDWPLRCCSRDSDNETMTPTTTLFLNVELSDCSDQNCTRLGDAHAYSGSWMVNEQRTIRTLLQPNATLTCYWTGLDGYQPYVIESHMIVTSVLCACAMILFLILSNETCSQYQEAKLQQQNLDNGVLYVAIGSE